MLKYRSGETLIEVMLATALFSMILVGAIVVMNRGTALAQRSLETTLTRQQMDAQAEMLRFSHDAYLRDSASKEAKVWRDALSMRVDNITQYKLQADANGRQQCPKVADVPGSFAVGVRTIESSESEDGEAGGTTQEMMLIQGRDIAAPVTYGRVVGDRAEGIWAQVARVTEGDSASVAYDVHIRACWDPMAIETPVMLGTIVRLYEPAQ